MVEIPACRPRTKSSARLVEDLMTLAWALPVRRKDIQRHEKAYALLEGKEVRVNL
jgi:hypothetical protein